MGKIRKARLFNHDSEPYVLDVEFEEVEGGVGRIVSMKKVGMWVKKNE